MIRPILWGGSVLAPAAARWAAGPSRAVQLVPATQLGPVARLVEAQVADRDAVLAAEPEWASVAVVVPEVAVLAAVDRAAVDLAVAAPEVVDRAVVDREVVVPVVVDRGVAAPEVVDRAVVVMDAAVPDAAVRGVAVPDVAVPDAAVRLAILAVAVAVAAAVVPLAVAV